MIKKYQESIEDSNNEIKKLELKIKRQSSFNEDISFLENQIEEALKENTDIEEILKLQEKEIKTLSLNNTYLIEEIQKATYEREEYRNGLVELKSNLEVTQNAISQLDDDIKIKNEKEQKKKKTIEEKEKEIENLKKLLNEMKGEYNSNSNLNKQLENQLKNARKENSQLNSIMQNTTQKKVPQEESFSEVKPELNEVEEENLKEIAGLMKKVLDE